MVDMSRAHVWAWDARPYPAFPDFETVWADGSNWETGHWITGRIEGVPLDRLIAAICKDFGVTTSASIPVDGFLQEPDALLKRSPSGGDRAPGLQIKIISREIFGRLGQRTALFDLGHADG